MTSYKLFMDDGAGGAFSELTNYDGSALQYQVTQGVETSIVTGKLYRFYYVAVNDIGTSDWSEILSIALADPPNQANAPTRYDASSDSERITVTWTQNTDTDTPYGAVTGYKLWMDDGLGGDFTEIYYGENTASLTTYQVTGLTAGRQYRFRTQAENYNGFGDLSAITYIYACTEPSGFDLPQYVSSTSSSMTISWSEPSNNGGCPLTGYIVYRDDADSTDPSVECN